MAAPAFHIETVAQTGSTNADLLSRLQAGEIIAEHHWLRALSQTSGRGRLGRQWHSDFGNLYCSSVVQTYPSDPSAHTLSFVAALAVFDTLAEFLSNVPALRLKWPNDVEVDQAKIAGILLERHADNVVIGIGINVTHAPDIPDRRTISLASESDCDQIDAERVLLKLATAFAKHLTRWRGEGLAGTIATWTRRAHIIGERLIVSNPDGTKITGTYHAIAEDGALRLRLADGTLTQIYAGDIAPA